MGVPKFTRFICERYPCLLEVLNEYQIPEFDNLYLDMNGIIHCCSHPNDADAHFRITEETIFKNIFLYVEILFRTIKPQKLFFMAVDGVAPRAKINQQRSRRFKSAREAEIIEAKARAKGEKLPDEARFDSNCITPGTKFMATLTERLKYFVAFKMSTDKLWQKCKIILSGPEVPGEGEHKIMDYIRWMKAQPDHDPNTRHCLYGLDADLIMLSLCTHEPHFAVLREEVKYGGHSQKTTTPPEKTKFCLLHVSLLREYMEHEFESVKDKLPFDFDIEKIIDDWVLMGLLVGNDFIPHLPNLHIAKNALPTLYKAYIEVLPTLDGYINEAGVLNLVRFEKLMEKLSQIDVQNFQEHQADLKYFEAKVGRKLTDASPQHTKKPFKKDLENLIASTEEMLLGHSDEEDDFLDAEDSDNDTYALEFTQHKHDYYLSKFEYEKVDAEVMREQAEAYVIAIQWNLHYYYDGCCSWSWYYPHHYAPYISDIKDFKDLKFTFELGTPFLPFQQLLAVLPAASKNLLPEPYQKLLTEDGSPIIDYYPEDFRTDLNEKKEQWEAIVLIPFIDEKNLIDAMEPYNAQLTSEEQLRNKHGPMSIIEYTKDNQGVIEAPELSPTIESHAKITLVDPKDIDIPKNKLVKGLSPGVKLNTYFLGFPTLRYLQHDVQLEKAKVKVFEQPSRNENMLISIHPRESPGIEKLASELLGKIIFIKWPHLLEARVIAVSDGKRKFVLVNSDEPYSLNNLNRETFKGPDEMQWTSQARDVAMGYKSRFGIVVGDIDTLIHVTPIIGRRYIMTSQGRMSLEKEWGDIPYCYPYQSIVKDIDVEETSNVAHKDIAQIYEPKSTCFMLGHPHYGAMGKVVEPGVIVKSGRIKVAMNIGLEPDFKNLKREQHEVKMQYMHGFIAAQRLGISSHLLSRITGSIFVVHKTAEGTEKKQNIGLNLKYNKKNKELPGYTRRVNGQWMYSSKSIGLIRNYMKKFPKLFERLVHNVGNDIFSEEDLFFPGCDFMDIVTWLKDQSVRSVEPRNCDHEGLDPDIVLKLEKELDKFVEKNEAIGKTVIMQVKPHLLFKPGINSGNIPLDVKAKHKLFDRITAVKENSSVPLGYKGTLIGIRGQSNDSDILYDILFDQPFVGGISFNGGAQVRTTKFHESDFINISHGMRAEQDITGIPNIPDRIVKKKQNKNQQQQQPQQQQQQDNNTFASFNHKNFFPQFNQAKGGDGSRQQNQKQNSPKVKLMKKNNQEVSVKNEERREAPGKPHQKKMDVPPPPVPEKGVKKPIEQNQNSEFQILWNKLQTIPQQPPVNQKVMMSAFPPLRPAALVQAPAGPTISDTLQDPSAFLKAVLKIPDDSARLTGGNKQSKRAQKLQSQAPPQLSSMSSSSLTTSTNKKPFTFPPTPPIPTANIQQASSNAPPNMVQQLFDHARQAREDNVSYCARVLSHYQLLGIGMPRYFYTAQKNMTVAQIVLPDMQTFYGELCPDHASAAESAAKRVYTELKLDHAMKPCSFLMAPNAWVNMTQPVVPMMTMGPLPEKPLVRPPVNWNNLRMPQPGFTQMAPPRMNHTVPIAKSPDSKSDVKPITPFVPLQAQKKTRSRNSKDSQQEASQKAPPPIKTLKAKPKENSPKIVKDERPAKDNEQSGKAQKDNPPAPKHYKNPRQRRSRIAANFGSTSTANGGEQ